MWPIRTRLCRFACLALLVLLASGVPVIRAACPDEMVKVTVVTILATDKSDKVCPMLCWIAQEVRKKRPELTGFCQGTQTCKSVPVGQEDRFDLVDNQSAQVTVRHGANDKNRVCLKVKAPGVGEITYTAVCGKFFPIVTDFRTKKNETLIIAIRVETCKK